MAPTITDPQFTGTSFLRLLHPFAEQLNELSSKLRELLKLTEWLKLRESLKLICGLNSTTVGSSFVVKEDDGDDEGNRDDGDDTDNGDDGDKGGMLVVICVKLLPLCFENGRVLYGGESGVG